MSKETDKGRIMKTYCKGFQVSRKIIDNAILDWRYHEAGRKNFHRIYKEYGSPEQLREILLKEIKSRTLTFPKIRYSLRREGTKGKMRLIGVENVKQQIAEYIIIGACREFYEKVLGYHQYAGIVGRGSLRCSKAIRSALKKWPNGYYVKGDIRKCYDSMYHDMVLRHVSKYLHSSDLIYLNNVIIDTMGCAGVGLNLGGAYSMFATNLMLADAYHYVESLKKLKNGKIIPLVKRQIWYMDDYVLFGTNKRDLVTAGRLLEQYLAKRNGLSVKPWKVSKCGVEPIDMCGYSHLPYKTTIRGGIFVRSRKAFKNFSKNPSPRRAARPCSYYGYFKNSDTDTFSHKSGIEKAINTASNMMSKETRKNNRKVRRKETR